MDSKLVAIAPTFVVAFIMCGYFKILNIYIKNPEIRSLQTFDFSILYTTLPQNKLKYRLEVLIRKFLLFQNKKKLISITNPHIFSKTGRFAICWISSLMTYICHMCHKLAFQWGLTVLLSELICFYIHMRLNFFRIS